MSTQSPLAEEMVNAVYELSQANMVLAQQIGDLNSILAFVINSAQQPNNSGTSWNTVADFINKLCKK